MYGLHSWNFILEKDITYQWPYYVSLIYGALFYFNTLKDESLEPEAHIVLGKEFVSGLVIVPVWGIILLGYFIWTIVSAAAQG